jgi:hypothetical protein
MVAGLAYYLSQKFNPQFVQQMKLLYEDELKRALEEDGSSSSSFITPKIIIQMSRSNGKFAQFISDRSGQAFPYKEMVIEWNGSRVHVSEFEPKHPQLEPKPAPADPQGLANARPQTFSAQTGDGGFMNVDLTLPAPFAFSSNRGMVPDNGSSVNRRREATATLGNVTISIT